jgi:hypothetical protein
MGGAGITVVQMLFGFLIVLHKPEIWKACCDMKRLMFGTGLEVLLDPDWLVGYRITSAIGKKEVQTYSTPLGEQNDT